LKTVTAEICRTNILGVLGSLSWGYEWTASVAATPIPFVLRLYNS